MTHRNRYPYHEIKIPDKQKPKENFDSNIPREPAGIKILENSERNIVVAVHAGKKYSIDREAARVRLEISQTKPGTAFIMDYQVADFAAGTGAGKKALYYAETLAYNRGIRNVECIIPEIEFKRLSIKERQNFFLDLHQAGYDISYHVDNGYKNLPISIKAEDRFKVPGEPLDCFAHKDLESKGVGKQVMVDLPDLDFQDGEKTDTPLTKNEKKLAGKDLPLYQATGEKAADNPSFEPIKNSEQNISREPENREGGRIIHPDEEVRPEVVKPNATYERNGYEYKTNEFGHTKSVYCSLELKMGGRTKLQDEIGRMGFKYDEGGHLIGTRFNGPTDAFNIVPQNWHLNHSEWRRMENEWAAALEEGKEVSVLIELTYNSDSIRPTGFEVVYQIDGVLTGKKFPNRNIRK